MYHKNFIEVLKKRHFAKQCVERKGKNSIFLYSADVKRLSVVVSITLAEVIVLYRNSLQFMPHLHWVHTYRERPHLVNAGTQIIARDDVQDD